jgi:hypothetical protein
VTYDVSYDDIKELAKKGAYMVAIEKEGAGVQFYRYADYFGIALLNSRGFLVDYAKRLLKDAAEEGFGCRIAILTDFDISGLLIASKVPDVIRIGVGFEIIEWLQQNGYPNLTQEDVEEPYTPKEFSEEVLERLDATEEELEYLKGNRIEIDSILAVLNDNGKIWEYILYKLSENFENANYNRSIFTPDHVISEAQESLNKMVEKLGIRVTRDNRTKLWSKYIEYQGFLNISAEEKTNTDALKQKEETDYHMKPILDDIAEVVKKHTDRVNTVVDEYDAFKVYQEVDQYDMSGIYDIAINMKAYEVQCPFEILSIRESITSIIERGPCG